MKRKTVRRMQLNPKFGWRVGAVLSLATFACSLEQPLHHEQTSSSLTKISLDIAQDTFVSLSIPETSYGDYSFLTANSYGTKTIFIQPEDVRGILQAHDPNNLGPAVIESAKIVLNHHGWRGAPLVASSLRNMCLVNPTWRWDEADASLSCADFDGANCVAEWPASTTYEPIPGIAYPDPVTMTTSIDVTTDMIEVASGLDCAHPGWRIGVPWSATPTYHQAHSTEATNARYRPKVLLGIRALQPEICGDGIDNDNSGAQDDVAPWAPELCDNGDNDCDGQVDEDSDGDGYDACDDCNIFLPTIHPGAAEVCDGLDNNCDGTVDPGCVCSSPADCNNQACVDGRCGACTTDADCGSPWRCFGGVCYEPPS